MTLFNRLIQLHSDAHDTLIEEGNQVFFEGDLNNEDNYYFVIDNLPLLYVIDDERNCKEYYIISYKVNGDKLLFKGMNAETREIDEIGQYLFETNEIVNVARYVQRSKIKI